MEFKLSIDDLITDVFIYTFIICMIFFGVPLLKMIFFISEKIANIFGKLVQKSSSRDIIVMSQGGSSRHGKKLNQQRSLGRKRSY